MGLKQLIPPFVKAAGKNVLQWIRSKGDVLLSFTYLYTCSVCGQRVKDFLPISNYYTEKKKEYGNPYRFEDVETLNFDHYTCPRCGADDRSRLYALYFEKKLRSLSKGSKLFVLDIAPTHLRPFLVKNEKVTYRCADLYKDDVDDKVDITDMHIYPDNSFDVFICSHVLEHVENDRKALSELFRILKPNGWGILMVPINLTVSEIDEDPTVMNEAERWRRFGQFDHVRYYSKQGFLQRIQSVGFAVHQLGIDFFGKDIFHRSGISLTSVLYVAEKKESVQPTPYMTVYTNNNRPPTVAEE